MKKTKVLIPATAAGARSNIMRRTSRNMLTGCRIAGLLVSFATVLSLSSSAAEIHEAAEEGDLATIKQLLGQEPELLDARRDDGMTPLHMAAYNGRTEAAAFLIERGADVRATTTSGSTPLHGAAYYGHAEAIRLLIANGADVHTANQAGFTPLLSAAVAGRVDVLELLIAGGADVNVRGDRNWTALTYAADAGHAEAAELLLDRGAEVNIVTEDGSTPLMRAVWSAHRPVVRLLVERGADVDVAVEEGPTPLFFAVAFREKAISDLLLEKGKVVDLKGQHGLTMLHYAAARGLEDQVEALLDKGADVNSSCVNGKTPLHYAAAWGHGPVVALLVARGAKSTPAPDPGLKGDYLGMKKPGAIPEAFAPGAFLTPFSPHGSLAFSPDGSELFWCHHAMPIQAMWWMKKEGDTWSRPVLSPLTEPGLRHHDGHPTFTADGGRVYFHSTRSGQVGVGYGDDSNIWYAVRTANGWSEPVNLGPPVNTEAGEYGATLSKNGTLYLVRQNAADGLGGGDIYRAPARDGRFAAPANLGAAVNTEHQEINPTVAPDESYLVFASDRPEFDNRSLRLFVSFQRQDGTWTEAVSLPEIINEGGAWQPVISPDGDYLFFSSRRSGSDEYYWVDTSAIGELEEMLLGKAQPTSAPPISFEQGAQSFEPAITNQIALGDLDHDGDLDAVASNMQFNDSRVWLNDGKGQFSATDQLLTQQGHGVGLGDLDGDGDLDIVMTCAGYGTNNVWHHQPSRVYLNDGAAQFDLPGQDLGDTELSGNGVQLHDIDGDGDLDAMIHYYQEDNGIYLNDGRGRFARAATTFPDGSVFGDLDADGDVDIFVRERGDGLRTMLNDGKGHFSDHWSLNASTPSYGWVALGDLDGDGDADAVITNGDHRSGHYPSRVLFNDGSGRFSDSGLTLPRTRWGRIALGDLNNDGCVDAFVANLGMPDQVWVNDGEGRLLDTGIRLGGNALHAGCSVGDLDGDGDLDIFAAYFGDGPNTIWFNSIPPAGM